MRILQGVIEVVRYHLSNTVCICVGAR
jgi:hypothetical protein